MRDHRGRAVTSTGGTIGRAGLLKELRNVLIGIGIAVVLVYAIVIGSMYAECAVTPAHSGGLWSDVCDARAFWSMMIGGVLVAGVLVILLVVWVVADSRGKNKKSCPRCGYRVAVNAKICRRCGYDVATKYRPSVPSSPESPPPPSADR